MLEQDEQDVGFSQESEGVNQESGGSECDGAGGQEERADGDTSHETGATASVQRRKRFSEEDDMLLLTQVNVDLPFATGYGKMMAAWERLAAQLRTLPSFKTSTISGKTCQARFNKLLDKHRTWEASSKRKSGVDESETSRIKMLTELSTLVADHARIVKDKQLAAEAQQQDKDASGAVCRELACSRLARAKRKRSEEESSDEAAADAASPESLHDHGKKRIRRNSRTAANTRADKSLELVSELVSTQKASMESFQSALTALQAEETSLRRLELELKERELQQRERERQEREEDRKAEQERFMAMLELLRNK